MKKSKHAKFYAFVSIVITSAISLSIIGSLSSSTSPVVNSSSISNNITNNIATTKSSVTPKPLNQVSDLKITSPTLETGAISTEEVTDKDGNYILTASGTSSGAKVVKLNFQMQYLYQWSYSDSSYSTRQIVADTDDLGYYYALLVNKDVSIVESVAQTSRTSYTFTLAKPALVVQLYDTGSSFEQRNVYQLQLPDFSINNKDSYSSNNLIKNNVAAPSGSDISNNIWDDIYVQAPIGPSDTNEKLSFIRSEKPTSSEATQEQTINASSTTTETVTSPNTSTNGIYINDASKSKIYKLLEKTYSGTQENGNSSGASSTTFETNTDYYILKQVYLNNVNNMVYIKDLATNKKMILIFGGNTYQSFWFYDFEVKTSGSNNYSVTPLLYANYDFDPFNATSQDEVYYGNVKKQYYYLPFMKKNKVSNLAWYVGGAKTIKITNHENGASTSYVFLAMMQPNISDYNNQLYKTTNSSTSKQNSNNDSNNNSGDVKKGTFGTPEEVNWFNSSTHTNFANNRLPDISTSPAPQNDNFQNGGQTYQNKQILVGSSSINASYQVLSPGQYSNGGLVTNYEYPFSAIQSLTILPVMSSEIAALVCVDPTNNEGKPNGIYLNSFFEANNTTGNQNKFSLFNCRYVNGTYYRFNFGKMFISNPYSWTQDKPGVQYDLGAVMGNGNLMVGIDDFGFSRILLNKNPKATSTFQSTNDGWTNTASQKIISFSPQLSSSTIKVNDQTGISLGTYNKVIANLIVRGYSYSLEYDLNLIQGIGLVPIANVDNSYISGLNPRSDKLNAFNNLLSVSYSNNTWTLSYQDTNKKYLSYLVSYDPSGWSFSLSSTLTNTSKLTKVVSNLDQTYFFIDEQNNIKFNNYSTSNNGGSLDINSGSAITDNPNIWGSVSKVDDNYLKNANLISKTANEIISDSSLLNQLVVYTGGWSVDPVTNEPINKPMIINPRAEGSSVIFDVALMYTNGVYYTSASFDPAKYPNVVQISSLQTPTFRYDGFAAMEPWVLPTIISASVALLLIFIGVGVSVPMLLHKQNKMAQKGFSATNKKIDTLTTAVGSVYQKVITQTKNTKQPQMLKSASPKPNVPKSGTFAPKVNPGASNPKPSSPTPKKPG